MEKLTVLMFCKSAGNSASKPGETNNSARFGVVTSDVSDEAKALNRVAYREGKAGIAGPAGENLILGNLTPEALAVCQAGVVYKVTIEPVG